MMVPDEMLVKYRQRRQRDLEDCVRHVREGKMNFIEKVGHQLKGNALTFGYPELSLIGEELEAAAKEGRQDQIWSAINKFRMWVHIHLS
jgi:HPt (histidine-containing phosphotransfer) domain-containing protein